MGKQTTDFRYNTGATRVPWAAVGENYNVHDLMEIIRFLMLECKFSCRPDFKFDFICLWVT